MRYIHIAGTNGKGSAAEYIYQIIRAAGKSAGCFTSPHLVSPAERFRANGRNIDAAELDTLLGEVEQVCDRVGVIAGGRQRRGHGGGAAVV